MISTAGIITTLGGSGTTSPPTTVSSDGASATTIAMSPGDVVLNGKGDLLYVEGTFNLLRRIQLSSGKVYTVAGSCSTTPCSTTFNGDNISATSANLNAPMGPTLDAAGNILFCQRSGQRCSTLDMSAKPQPQIQTFAGTGVASFDSDAPMAASSARLNNPGRVAVDSWGRVLIVDAGNARIRRIDAQGVISTVAGGGSSGVGNGGPATSAVLSSPVDVVFDSKGAMYLAEATAIRKVVCA
jgi:hypothetical protein